MTPTVYVALLTHQTAPSGKPLHLSLHTTAAAADSAVMAALRADWDKPNGFSYGKGTSDRWRPDLFLAEAEREGYTAEVRELPVELTAEPVTP